MHTPGLTEPMSAGPPMTLPEALRGHWLALSAPTSGAARFAPERLDGLPTPVRRWLARAIAPGTPLLRAAVLRQHGEIKVGRWQRYEADWLLAPPAGFIWAATTHLGPVFIRGFDRYTEGAGQMRWRLLGRVPLMSATGADVTRSAMGRLAGELFFVPAVALSDAVTWAPVDERRAVALVDAAGWMHRVTVTVAQSGRLERIDVPRWGNPDGKGYREHLFTALLEEPEGCFDGFTVPLSARAGWWQCPDHCADAEFLRFTIDRVSYR